jgi:hypothetical protein
MTRNAQEYPTICSEWSRGPYEEILPPPLIAGTTPEEAIKRLIKASLARGVKASISKTGLSSKRLRYIALLHHHQLRLRETIAGHTQSVVEQALYAAVIQQRQPLSLRPLTLEKLQFATFAPAVTHLGGDRWRVGVLGHGRLETFAKSNASRAIEHAQGLYLAWVEANDDGLCHSTRACQELAPWIQALRMVGIPYEHACSAWAKSSLDLSLLDQA